MVSQLMEALKPCGILAAIQAYPEEMRPLFCINDTGEKLRVVQYTRTVTDRETMVSVRRVLYGP